MSEELNPNGLGYMASRDPATLAAWQRATDLVDRDVYDIHGRKLGRVTRCFAEEGELFRCDVTLTDNAKSLFRPGRDVAGVPATWIARVDHEGVRLRKAGEEVLHPENPAFMAAEDRGAPGFPRKNR